MSPRTPTLPPTDASYWRVLLACAHPDSGGSHGLFIWAEAVREHVLACRCESATGARDDPVLSYRLSR